MRKFNVPKVITNADAYYKLVDMDIANITEPPIIMSYTDAEVRGFRDQKLVLKHPCHNQAVERHIKVVSESSSKVVGNWRRDGLIRQKLKSRRLIKRYDTKNQYKCAS